MVPNPRAIIGDNIDRNHRASKVSPCPVCGSGDQCIFDYQPTVIHVWCKRVVNDASVNFGWSPLYYHRLAPDGTHAPPRATYQRRTYPLASAEMQHRALSITADVLGLSDEHEERLMRRGYSIRDCGPDYDSPYRFCSLPADMRLRAKAAYEIMLQLRIDPLEILGFSRDHRKADSPIYLLPNVVGPALIEFFLDVDGTILGYTYDPDERTDGKKHLLPIRTRASELYHVVDAYGGTDVIRLADDKCWHVEGMHKANLINQFRGDMAVATAGVGNADAQVYGAMALDPARVCEHWVAVDADMWGKRDESKIANCLIRAGYRVVLVRWPDPCPKEGPDDAMLRDAEFTATPYGGQEALASDTTYQDTHHAWQDVTETPEERAALLRGIADGLRDRVVQHIDNPTTPILIVAAPPGLGKSHAVSEIGAANTAHTERDIAWIAERHEMYSQIANFQYYRQILPAAAGNCSAHVLHGILSHKGFNTHGIHNQELTRCAYLGQFIAKGSAFYMNEYVVTRYPTEHQGIIIDEWALPRWLPPKIFTINDLHATCAGFPTGQTADLFLRALQATITDASQSEKSGLSGKAFFDALDARCDGHLVAWLGVLQQDAYNTNERPWADIDINELGAKESADAKLKVTLPHILIAIIAELPYWQHGRDWNSRIRVAAINQEHGEIALSITQPRKFHSKGQLPPITILDATADEEISQRAWDGKAITIVQPEVTPPPHMQHVAVRTGKRYGKWSLERSEKDLGRAIAQTRYILANHDPDGSKASAGKVGIITYKGIEDDVRIALGIPEGCSGHFGAVRGSNRLEHCEILIILGTPMMNPSTIIPLVQSLYFGEDAIDTTFDETTHTYVDARVQHLNDYLIRAELTQCAHRNRPLRHDGRVVISLCNADIDFLPITRTYTALPRLNEDGEKLADAMRAKNAHALAAAAATLGEGATVRDLAAAAHVRWATANNWLREQQPPESNIMSIAETLPGSQYISNWTLGNSLAIEQVEHPPDLLSAVSPGMVAPPNWQKERGDYQQLIA